MTAKIAPTVSLAHWFESLPESMQRLLGVGSVGKLHILDVAAHGLASAPQHHAANGPGLEHHCAAMVLAAFGETPLSGELAAQITNTPALIPLLSEESRTLLRTVVRHWKRPDNLEYFQRIVQRRDMDKVKHFLKTQVDKEPENLFWREQATAVGMYEADYDWLTACLTDTFLRDLGPLHGALMGQIELAKGNISGSQKCIQAVGDTFGKGWESLARARSTLMAGDQDSALALLLETLQSAPWQTQAALQAHDLIEGVADQRTPLQGSVAILLYSWNKAEDVNDALAAIHASDMLDHESATIYALDNGSSDETAEVMRSWQDRFTSQRMEVIELPVNVGAAAARNWLMHLPAVKATDWCIYLDDDALVPADWLALFGAAVQQYPDAGVWGCKVVDAAQPSLMQAVDYHLMPLVQQTPLDLTSVTPHEIKLSNLHIQVLDAGQFNYLRPCASVTGCCHLFRTSELHTTGDFSLFLSPSQYDDMERDLRMLAGGKLAVYQGHLCVHHRKRTGKASLVETTQEANALGNRYKMSVMHEPEEITASTALEQESLLADLLIKLRRIDQHMERSRS